MGESRGGSPVGHYTSCGNRAQRISLRLVRSVDWLRRDCIRITTFGIVNVPFAGQQIKPPYVTAYILLDRSDVPIQHLVLGCEASEVRIGMRVRAVWAPESERPATMKAITHFEPNGEPDVDPSTFATHL